jgi:hypothetical protein
MRYSRFNASYKCYLKQQYLLTELSPSWEAANYAATQDHPSILWNPKVHYRFTRALYWSLSWARLIQSRPPHPISLRSTIFFFNLCGVTLGTAATYWPIVPAPDDRWWWWWRNWWHKDWRGKSMYSEKTYPSNTLSTTNSTWLDPGLNPGLRGCNRAAWAMTRPKVYTWSSTYHRLPFWLTGRKSIWSYVGHIFVNSSFITFLIFLSSV